MFLWRNLKAAAIADALCHLAKRKGAPAKPPAAKPKPGKGKP